MDLKKGLNLTDVFTITVGTMISSGLFIIPGVAYARAGPASCLAYFLAALIALPTMLSAAELATAMPKAGGVYFFVSRSMGLDLGAIAGFTRWFSMSLKSAFSLIGIGVYCTFMAGFETTFFSAALCVFFVIINLLGIKLVGRTQTLLTGALIGILLFLAFFGLNSLSTARFIPFAPFGISSIFSTAAFVFISYGGMLAITGLAEEVKRPERNIPLGMLLSLAFTAFIYTLVIFVVVGVLEPEILQNTLTPITESAKVSLDGLGVVLSTAAALLAFTTTANAGIASASRYLLAMSRDRILPPVFQKVTQKTRIPSCAILFTGSFILLVIIFLSMELLVEVASALLMLTYLFTNLAVILMREKKKHEYRPKFFTPFYPWIQLLSIGGLLLLLLKTGKSALLLSLLLIGASFVWYRFYARSRGSNFPGAHKAS